MLCVLLQLAHAEHWVRAPPGGVLPEIPNIIIVEDDAFHAKSWRDTTRLTLSTRVSCSASSASADVSVGVDGLFFSSKVGYPYSGSCRAGAAFSEPISTTARARRACAPPPGRVS